ncbi:hypothetical protein TNCV_4582351 [Trichonephila clavipes]|nr:hypothetical protein TNCV_4582351 [Trichonephila clavipes]
MGNAGGQKAEGKRLQKTDISSAISKKEQAHTTAQQMRVGSVLSSDCRRQLIWRESGIAYRPEKYPGKGPISDMQYHGVGRHHDQWPHAPTCGCEWDYDGPTIH